MGERYFEAAEVERLIPALTRILDRIMPAHAEAESVAATLDRERRRIAVAGGAVVDQASWRQAVERLEALQQVVSDGLHAIAGLGGTPKDLGLGLVDFPTLRDGRVVNLCWKLGEPAVRWWHGRDEGYPGRKPL